jgi:hypothetical protein
VLITLLLFGGAGAALLIITKDKNIKSLAEILKKN